MDDGEKPIGDKTLKELGLLTKENKAKLEQVRLYLQQARMALTPNANSINNKKGNDSNNNNNQNDKPSGPKI